MKRWFERNEPLIAIAVMTVWAAWMCFGDLLMGGK